MNIRPLLILLILYWVMPMPGRAQYQRMDSLKAVIAMENQDAGEANALNKLSTEYSRSDIKRAKLLLYQSIRLSIQLKRADLLSYAYSHMAALQSNSGRSDSAYVYLKLLESLSKNTKGNYANGVLGYYNYTAGLLLKQQGNFRGAIPFMNLGLKYFKETGEPSAIAAQYLSIGNNYIKLLDFKKALDAHLNALNLFTKAGNKRGESFSYQNIAADFSEMKMPMQALPYAKKAMELKTRLQDTRGIAGAASGLADIYQVLGQDRLALEYYNKALSILRSLNLPQEESELQVMIGNYYARKNKFLEAKSAYESSLELAELTKDSALIHNAAAKLASVNKTGSLNDERALLSALYSNQKNGNKSMVIDIYRYLSAFYEQRSEFEAALLYKNKYLQASDEVHNSSLLIQLKSMEEQFRRERNIKEIAILKKDKEISRVYLQKQKNLKLSALVIAGLVLIILYVWIVNQRARNLLQMQKLRDDLSRDLHDDIGSRLTNIQFLTHISNQQEVPNTLRKQHITNIQQEIIASTQALDEIVWNMKTTPEDLDSLSVRIRRYAGTIFDDESVKVDLRIQPGFPDHQIYHETQRDLFLMFKEILNNIRKHAGAKSVKIDLAYQAGNLLLTVIDDGVGFDASKVPSKRNGLLNLKSRAEKWNGRFELKALENGGSQASLEIPYQQFSLHSLKAYLKRISKRFFKSINPQKALG